MKRDKMVVLGTAQLDLMALQLDRLLLELFEGNRVAAKQRYDGWIRYRDMSSEGVRLYWDELCRHGYRMMALANATQAV